MRPVYDDRAWLPWWDDSPWHDEDAQRDYRAENEACRTGFVAGVDPAIPMCPEGP